MKSGKGQWGFIESFKYILLKLYRPNTVKKDKLPQNCSKKT